MNHDELEKLHALKEAGYLTDEEFTAQKRSILTSDEPATPALVAYASRSFSFDSAGNLIDRERLRPFLFLVGTYFVLNVIATFVFGLQLENIWLKTLLTPGAGWLSSVFSQQLYFEPLFGIQPPLGASLRRLAALSVELGAFSLLLFRPIQAFSLPQQAIGVSFLAAFASLAVILILYLALPSVIDFSHATYSAVVYAAIIYWLLKRFGRSDAAAAQPSAQN